MSDNAPASDGAPVTLAEKVAAAMAEAGEVTKSARNEQQGYNYASAEAILAAVRGPLLASGVILYPPTVRYEDSEIQSSSNKAGVRTYAYVTFRFTDGREDLVVEDWRGEGQDWGDKATGKAYTNALKTFIRTAWLLPTEHDDPEASSPGERVSRGAAAALPAWAQPTDRPAEFGEALVPLIGRDRAASAYGAIKASLGDVPDLAVMVAKLVAAQVADVYARAGLEEDVASFLTREAGDLDPDAPVAPEPDPAPPADTAPTEPEPDPPEETPAPGSLDARALEADLPASITARTRALKAAGCTCPAPIVGQRVSVEGTLPDNAEDVNASCPLHGIPF